MNKLFVLAAIAGLLLFGILWKPQMAQSELVANHEQNLALFWESTAIETKLQKDVLRGMSLMLSNYDTFVTIRDQFQSVCARMKSSTVSLYGHISPHFDEMLDSYCAETENQMDLIETFKSRNAVLRNSIFFLQKLEIENSNSGRKGTLSEQESELISLSLLFVLNDSKDARDSLLRTLKSPAPKKVNTPRYQEIRAHAALAFNTESALNEVSNILISSKLDDKMAEIRAIYFDSYNQEVQKAKITRYVLGFLCLILLGILAYASSLIWKSNRAIREANANLENRVQERTKELEKSNEVIREQQNVLIGSAKSSALGEMAGQIAHEINSPLGAMVLTIQGLNKKVQAGSVKAEDISAKLNFLLQVTGKLTRIIGSMRKMAGHGGSELLTDTLVHEMVDDTLLLCEGRFKKSGIEFTLQNKLSIETRVPCRSNEIAQVIINLLNNAHDAVADCSSKWVRLEVAQNGGYISFRVIDSGSGISQANKTKLFTPNFTTKSLDAGTGFGLSICRKIAERHNGRIYLDSNQTHTTFTLEIPIEQTETLIEAVGA